MAAGSRLPTVADKKSSRLHSVARILQGISVPFMFRFVTVKIMTENAYFCLQRKSDLELLISK